MTLSGAEFAAGAAQLEAVWRQHLPAEPAWHWMPARQPFSAAMGGGYLATQRSVADQRFVAASPERIGQPLGPARQDEAQPAEMEQGEREKLQGEYEAEEEEQEQAEAEDPADARQLQRLAQQAQQQQRQQAGGAPQAQAQQQEQQQQPTQRRHVGSLSGADDPSASSQAGGAAAGVGAVPAAGAWLDLTCHVAYHLSYRVPVLYFEAVDRSGAPLRLEALLAALPSLHAAVVGGQTGTVVTQEEHPFLRRPFFMLHPCQTGAIMQLLLASDRPGEGASDRPGQVPAEPMAVASGPMCGVGATALHTSQPASRALQYLLAWLSVSGQPLGLSVPAGLWSHALHASPM